MKLLLVLLVALYAVYAQSPEEGEMVEGDMELTPDQTAAFMEQMAKKNFFASIRAGLWLDNGKPSIISFFIDPKIAGARTAIEQAVADYHQYTCLRFNEVSSRPSGPHLFFTVGAGCSSPVGRLADGNSIRLARGCFRKGIIMHEMGHSIGLFHEQSRPDRDQYVEILIDNVYKAFRYNFKKLTIQRIESRGTLYDYDSMMHYGSSYFTKQSGILTIKTKDPKDQNRIGNRSGFSETDKIQINKMYCQPSCLDKYLDWCLKLKSYCGTDAFVTTSCKKTCGTC